MVRSFMDLFYAAFDWVCADTDGTANIETIIKHASK